MLLPDEPYVFTADDGPEAFARTPTQLVSGRLLTWYGPSLVEAHGLRWRDSRRHLRVGACGTYWDYRAPGYPIPNHRR